MPRSARGLRPVEPAPAGHEDEQEVVRRAADEDRAQEAADRDALERRALLRAAGDLGADDTEGTPAASRASIAGVGDGWLVGHRRRVARRGSQGSARLVGRRRADPRVRRPDGDVTIDGMGLLVRGAIVALLVAGAALAARTVARALAPWRVPVDSPAAFLRRVPSVRDAHPRRVRR